MKKIRKTLIIYIIPFLLCMSWVFCFTGCSKDSKEKKESKENYKATDNSIIPVYDREDSELIIEYLKGLPSSTSSLDRYEELGLIVDAAAIDEKDRQSQFDKLCDFMEKIESSKADEKYAVTLVLFSEENKPLYIYVSSIGGKIFAAEYDGFSSGEDQVFAANYEKIMKVKDKYTDGTKYTTFYLVGDKDKTEDEVKKMREEGGYEFKDLFWLYDTSIV